MVYDQQGNNSKYLDLYRNESAHLEILRQIISNDGSFQFDPNRDLPQIQNLRSLCVMQLIEEVIGSPSLTYAITDEGRTVYTDRSRKAELE
jgi:hypothetical protein